MGGFTQMILIVTSILASIIPILILLWLAKKSEKKEEGIWLVLMLLYDFGGIFAVWYLNWWAIWQTIYWIRM